MSISNDDIESVEDFVRNQLLEIFNKKCEQSDKHFEDENFWSVRIDAKKFQIFEGRSELNSLRRRISENKIYKSK